MINEASTRTFVNNTNIVIANRFLKLQTVYSNEVHEIIKVYDQLLDKESILKILKDSENQKLLELEFKLIMKLNSNYIIRGYELYSYDNLYFYSMEFIKNDFKLNYLNIYIYDILKAFDYIHRKSLIHNDIKLNNFLFEENRAILIDFSKTKTAKTYIDIENENHLLSRFLIKWINYNLKIDILGNPKKAESFINKNDINKLIKMFYKEKNAI